MRRFVLGSIIAVGAGACVLSIMAMKGVEKIRPNTFVGPVAVGGLTRLEAAERLRLWWEMEKARELQLVSAEIPSLKARPASQLGLSLDDGACVGQLPAQTFPEAVADVLTPQPEPLRLEPVIQVNAAALEPLKKMIAASLGTVKPARATYKDGALVVRQETPGRELDQEEFVRRAVKALSGGGEIDLPLKEAEKRVSDEALSSIKEVVSEFATSFPTYKRSRCENIKLASEKIDGIVLLPGERFSFNGTVGRRTAENGFKVAGVYKNGKHDVDVGGGICQVSSTLYNAALFANLKIVQRQNHSMPVPYVPVGRDATLDYGTIDLVIENSLEKPIALSAEYKPGRLTFRVLGMKDEDLQVKVVSEGHKSWDAGQKVTVDPRLKPGARRVDEKGSRGHSVKTYRLVYKGGELVDRQPLGTSYYRGGVRLISVGPSAPSPQPSQPAEAQRS